MTIGKVFAEADRRDPDHRRTWIALVDGDIYQLGLFQAAAAARGITLAVVIDLCRVRNYADSRGWQGWEALPGAGFLRAQLAVWSA